MDDNNGAVRLVPVLSKLCPSDLGPIVAEDRGMGGTVFSRGHFLTIHTLEIDHIDLDVPLISHWHRSQGPLNSRSVWYAMRGVVQDPRWYTQGEFWIHQNRPFLQKVQRGNSRK